MRRLSGLVLVGFALVLTVTPSWGGPPNPTASDVNGNTAGGTDALTAVTNGGSNTAFGATALPMTPMARTTPLLVRLR